MDPPPPFILPATPPATAGLAAVQGIIAEAEEPGGSRVTFFQGF